MGHRSGWGGCDARQRHGCAVTDGAFRAVLDLLRPGMNVYVQGASGELPGLAAAMRADPERTEGVRFWSCLVPGFNTFDYAGLPGTCSLTTFMCNPALKQSAATGRTEVLEAPYSGIHRIVRDMPFDLVIVHGAGDIDEDTVRFGVCADFPQAAMAGARRSIALLNQRTPCLAGAAGAPAARFDALIECDSDLLQPATEQGAATPEEERIARFAAGLVPDGAALQMGIGRLPGRIGEALLGHHGLRLRSGVVDGAFRKLAMAGALDVDARHEAGTAWGDEAFYAWLAETDLVDLHPASLTHNAVRLAAGPRFVAINAALEVDLSGQANLEWRGGAKYSSVGGAPDFASAARCSEGGLSVIALPSVTASGASRLSVRLNARTVSLPWYMVDAVVTEFGVAHLRGRSAEQRARAMITIAAPQHRDALEAGLRAEVRAAAMA
jgi:hypothetical protein